MNNIWGFTIYYLTDQSWLIKFSEYNGNIVRTGAVNSSCDVFPMRAHLTHRRKDQYFARDDSDIIDGGDGLCGDRISVECFECGATTERKLEQCDREQRSNVASSEY